MTEAFVRILNMSISASYIVAAVLLLRVLLPKVPKWTVVLLWGIVALRLVFPVSIETTVSLIPDSVAKGEVVSEWMDDYVGGIDIYHRGSSNYEAAVEAGREPIPDSTGEYYVVTKHGQLSEPSTFGNTIMPVLAVVWIAGITFLVFHTVISYWQLRRKLGKAVIYKYNVFQSEYVESPFILGIFRPRIYVPYGMEPKELVHVLAHEKAHIHRGDHWWKPFGYLLLVIHWFNPLMWVAYTMFCRDIELACDEKVIRELNNEQRADYTQALLSLSVGHHSIAACPLAFGEVGVKDRVKSVMQYKKPGFWIIVLALIACLGVAVCFLTDPEEDSFTIRIVVPAGSEESFVYSEEEISPLENYVIVSSGEGLGDTEVILKPVYAEYENVYEPAIYMTPGMPVKLFAEKGGWFKIGINMQNPTDQDKEVFVEVKYVEVRIADKAEPYPEKETMLSSEKETDETFGGKENVEYADKVYTIAVQNYTAQEIGRGEVRPLVNMTEEDAQTLLQIAAEVKETFEGSTDCLRDCAININGRLLYYHSSCGTFYEPDLGVMSTFSSVEVGNLGMSYRLTEAQKNEVNEILKKYITLQE